MMMREEVVRRIFTRIIASLLILAALCGSCMAGTNIWTITDGLTSNPGDQYIYALAVTPDGSVVYCGTGGGRVFTYTFVNAPVVSFTGTPLTGTPPLTVTFTETSTQSPTTWNWSFGDGEWYNTTVAAQKNTTHEYASVGTYTVGLTASNTVGSSTLSKTNYINVTSAVVTPVAAFSANATSGSAPVTILFTDASTNVPTSWLWDFGDGSSTSTEQNPIHEFTTTGTYNVRQTATNSAGSNSITKTNYITVSATVTPTPTTTPSTAPVAAFSANKTEGDTPLSVKFTDASTNTPTSWSWNFGDGGSSTEQNPVHQFTTTGTYTISLTATNVKGSDTMTKTGYITVIAPKVESNNFAVTGVNTTATGAGQNVSITTGVGVTTSGNVVTIQNTGSWSSLAITMKDTPETSGTKINGTVETVKAVTAPVTATVGSAGTPTVQISLNMSEMPGTTSSITQTITKDPDATAQSSFSLFASSQGKQIDDIAYTLNIVKTNLANAGNGGIIQSATLTMTVSKSWVDTHGGVGHISVLRRADDGSGTTQILTPTVTGPDGSGDYTITVISPDGLSIFALVSISATTSGSTSVSSGSDSPGSPVSSVSPTVQPTTIPTPAAPRNTSAGPWTTFSMTGQTHLTQIKVQTVQTIKDLFINSENMNSLPQGISYPGARVYEYHKVDVYHATNDDINKAVIDFTVSESYLAEQKMTIHDVQLMRYHDNTWEKLPTEYVGMKDGNYIFRATSGGFSYFATALVKNATIVKETTPTITTTSTAAPTPNQVAAQRPTPLVPVVSQPTTTAVPAPVLPDTGFPLAIVALIGAGCVGLIGSGWWIRRWWIRRQNPALFRDYD
ncbi:MAG: PKD domain-containing protein [Methanoregula sp.]|nr:PKD domain-containing protein [Methanoregula sp.]